MSTMRAEYIVVSEGAKEALWLCELRSDMGYMLVLTKAHCGSWCAIRLVENSVISERSNYIAVRHHVFYECVKRDVIVMVVRQTSEMVADFLTKLLTFERF